MDLNHRPRPYQGSVVRFYKNLQDRGDCQTPRKSCKTAHFVGWVVGWKLARSSEEFASAYATQAEHFLDGLWLDSADLHSCPIGRGKGIGGSDRTRTRGSLRPRQAATLSEVLPFELGA